MDVQSTCPVCEFVTVCSKPSRHRYPHCHLGVYLGMTGREWSSSSQTACVFQTAGKSASFSESQGPTGLDAGLSVRISDLAGQSRDGPPGWEQTSPSRRRVSSCRPPLSGAFSPLVVEGPLGQCIQALASQTLGPPSSLSGTSPSYAFHAALENVAFSKQLTDLP